MCLGLEPYHPEALAPGKLGKSIPAGKEACPYSMCGSLPQAQAEQKGAAVRAETTLRAVTDKSLFPGPVYSTFAERTC